MGDGVVQIHSISIHSLRMEGDSPMRDCWIPLCLFQSTPSAWRETSHTVTAKLAVGKFQSTPSAWRETVSFPPSLGVDSYFNPLPPHGGRRCCQRQFSRIIYFNPLPPHGGRPISSEPIAATISFQSTPSAWRETVFFCNPLCNCIIFQSTPSAWRETHFPKIIHANITDFNPLPPHGGRRC